MTTGALIFLVIFCIAFGLFGIYAGLHKEDDKQQTKKSNHNNVGTSH